MGKKSVRFGTLRPGSLASWHESWIVSNRGPIIYGSNATLCRWKKTSDYFFFVFFSVWLHWRTNLYVGSEAADPMVISVCVRV